MPKDAPASPVDSALECSSGKIDLRRRHQNARMRKLPLRVVQSRDARAEPVQCDRPLRRSAAQYQDVAVPYIPQRSYLRLR
jgi:hypothetical protein